MIDNQSNERSTSSLEEVEDKGEMSIEPQSNSSPLLRSQLRSLADLRQPSKKYLVPD